MCVLVWLYGFVVVLGSVGVVWLVVYLFWLVCGFRYWGYWDVYFVWVGCCVVLGFVNSVVIVLESWVLCGISFNWGIDGVVCFCCWLVCGCLVWRLLLLGWYIGCWVGWCFCYLVDFFIFGYCGEVWFFVVLVLLYCGVVCFIWWIYLVFFVFDVLGCCECDCGSCGCMLLCVMFWVCWFCLCCCC